MLQSRFSCDSPARVLGRRSYTDEQGLRFRRCATIAPELQVLRMRPRAAQSANEPSSIPRSNSSMDDRVARVKPNGRLYEMNSEVPKLSCSE